MAAQDLDRIRGNVQRMIQLGAPEQEIDQYLSTEGHTPQSFRQANIEPKQPGMLGRAAGYVDGVVRQLANGATFGFADEIAAGMDALTGIGDTGTYGENVEKQRARDDKFKSDHPVTALASQVAGGVAGAIATGGVGGAIMQGGGRGAQALTTAVDTFKRVPRLLQPAVAAGGMGALAGFGEGEGGLGNRLENAASTGALATFVGGVALPLGVTLAKPAVNKAKDVLALNPNKVVDRRIAQAMRDDRTDPQRMLGRLQELGPEATLLDAGGENISSLGRAAAAIPGPAKQRAAEVLGGRQQGQGKRLAADAVKELGAEDDFYSTLEDLMKTRSAQATGAYDAAFAKTGVWSPRLQQFLDDPLAKDALTRGFRVQRNEALAAGRPFNPTDFSVTGFDEAGAPVLSGTPNMRALDTIKRGFDEILEGYRDKTSGKLVLNDEGRSINDVRKAFISELDNINPEYATARAAWAGPTRAMDAMMRGRRFIQGDAEITERSLKELNDSEKEFFRVGVARQIRDMIYQDTTAAARKFGENKGLLWDKLRVVFPDETSLNAFRKAVERETVFSRNSNKVLGGSPTARIEAEKEGLGAGLMEVGAEVLKGSKMGALRKGADLARDRFSVPRAKVADPLSALLLAPRAEAETYLQRLMAPPPIKPGLPGLLQQVRQQQGGLLGSAITGQQTGLLSGF